MAKKTTLDALRLIPLAELTLSPMNSRQTTDPAEIEAMAASLATTGLLQNLIGFQTPEGRVEIVGGGTRLRALQLLAAEGWNRFADMRPIDPVPVLVTDNPGIAVEWSGTENISRRDLHPADEIRAYAAAREQGAPPDRIARTYGVTAAHVTRRLALAGLPDAALDALREGKISLDVAKALTLAGADTERCLRVLQDAIAQGWREWTVRRAFIDAKIRSTDRRVQFVGMAQIRAAGIPVLADLFEDASYVDDSPAFTALFEQIGREAAESLQTLGGWKTAEFWGGVHWQYKTPFGLMSFAPTPGDLPDGDVERYDELAELANGGVLDAAGEAELAALQIRLDGAYDPEICATGHLVVYVGNDGKAETIGLKPIPGHEAADGDSGDGVTSRALPAKAPPQNLVDDLAKIKLAALQTALLDEPRLMIDLLAWQLTSNFAAWDVPLAISTSAPSLRLDKPEGLTLRADLEPTEPRERTDALPDTFAKWLTRPEADRRREFGAAIARLIASPRHDIAVNLAQAVQPDTRAIWTPTAAGYFKRLNSAALDAIYCDLTPADKADHPKFRALKSADKAKTLEALFSDLSVREAMGLSRAENARIDSWLPVELQWPAAEADEEADAAPINDWQDDDLDGAEEANEEAAA